MSLGTLGSTLNDELNRLANGGTYRDMDDMVDEALAAKQWANRENISPYSTDTVGVLNEIAGLGLDKKNWLDFNGVCNYLAGTTGLPAAAALRQIYPTTDLLTGVAPYYVDAATPRYNYPGFVYLNGIAGNYILTPDATALDVTGDIDIRVRVAMDDWTPAATSGLVAKWSGSTNFSYFFLVDANGTLGLLYTTDGTAGTFVSKYSTVATGVADGTAKWVRVTRSSSTGNVLFYLSDDGATWTQLGTTVTSTPSSIFSGTANLVLMANSSGGGELAAGKLYNAQIFASTDGTDKRLDVDLTTNVTSATYNQFTATTGQLFTIFGQDTLTNGGTAGSLLPITVGSSLAADSNDPKFLAHTGTNYVYTPGVSGNYLSVPDSAALDITGDIDLRWYGALDDWTPAALSCVLSKWIAGQLSYSLNVTTTGALQLFWTTDGTTSISKTSTATITVADGSPLWVRATLDVDNTASGNDVKFFTSTDGTTWTQLGSTVTTAGVTSIYAGTALVNINAASAGAGQSLAGKAYRAQILNGIDGTTVLDVDTSVITAGADAYVVPRTYTGQAGAFFTGTGLSLNGVAGNYVSTPDATQLDITGDLDLRCKVALTDWTPASETSLIDKTSSSSTRSYGLRVAASGVLGLYWSVDGTTVLSAFSTAVTGITDGDTKWVRATLDVNNGASGNTATFYLSDDGITWTQLGSAVTTAGTTSIYSSTSPLEIGSIFGGTSRNANGTFYEAIVKSGIDGFTVFDADFTQAPANALRMTESSSYKAVVTLNTTRYATINRSTSGRKTVAVTQPTWLFGTDDYMEVNNRYMAHSTSDENYVYLSGANGNYMSISDNPPLDVTGDIDLQVKVALDDWTPSGVGAGLITKRNTSVAYQFFVNVTNGLLGFTFSSNGVSTTTSYSTVAPTVSDGETLWVRATRVSSTGVVTFFTSNDGTTWTQLGAPSNTTPGDIFSSADAVEIGSRSGGTAIAAKGKFFRAIIKNGIDGPIVLDADASVITLPSQTTFVDRSSNAYTVTINKSGVGTFVSTGNYLYLPGIAGNYASAPDSAALDITGDIDVRVKVALDDWTPSTDNLLIAKRTITGSQQSYFFLVNTTGYLVFYWTTDGSTVNTRSSDIPAGITDGNTKWVRATLDVNNGASGNTTTFFTSDDGITWTQLGTSVTVAGTTSIFSGTSSLEIGSQNGGITQARGKFFRAQILNGINGTVAFDANFESSITSLLQTTFTESSTNGATVTINRSGSTFRSAGVIDAGYLYPGATNTFANSTTDFLNFGATDSATLLVFTRQWNTPANFGRTISKEGSTNTASGYLVQNYGTGLSYTATINSGTSTSAGVGTPTYIAGNATLVGFVLDRAAQTLVRYMNTTGTSVSAAGVGSLSSISPLDIGRNALSGGGAIDMEFVGAAIFRTALTATQIRQISNYFTNREVYL